LLRCELLKLGAEIGLHVASRQEADYERETILLEDGADVLELELDRASAST